MSWITRAYGASKLLLQANAPTIMVVGGVGAMGVGTVLACKKTLKIEEVLEPHAQMLERVEEGVDLHLESYTTEFARQDRIKIYTRAALDLGKLYAVPGVFFVGGAALVFGGHRILLQRNATLAMAFTTLKKAFDGYRQRVRDEFGEQADQGMLNGWTTKEVIGAKNKVETINTRDWDANEADPYNRVFEQGASQSWQPDLGVNKMFLSQQQRFAQERLNRRGYLYLSEVYEALGFPESDLARVVGWKVKRNPDGSKDFPMVDFGIDKPLPDDWKYSQDNAIYLDFNCQGLIVGGKIQKILERA